MNGGQAARNGGNDGGDDGARSESSEETYISLIVPMAVSPKLWSGLADSPGVVAAGEEEWQTFRIKRGGPCGVTLFGHLYGVGFSRKLDRFD